jgi:hypothetical protein
MPTRDIFLLATAAVLFAGFLYVAWIVVSFLRWDGR